MGSASLAGFLLMCQRGLDSELPALQEAGFPWFELIKQGKMPDLNYKKLHKTFSTIDMLISILIS